MFMICQIIPVYTVISHNFSGIACIRLLFVDGRGTPVQLMPTAKPSPHAYKDILEKNMFEGMVHTNLYQLKPGSRSPGGYKTGLIYINTCSSFTKCMFQL